MDDKKRTTATIYTTLEAICPYCGVDVQESGSDVSDLTGFDFEEENEIECTNCGKTFIAVVE